MLIGNKDELVLLQILFYSNLKYEYSLFTRAGYVVASSEVLLLIFSLIPKEHDIDRF